MARFAWIICWEITENFYNQGDLSGKARFC